ncbi:YqjF family protein [Chitinophagaceae bacterium MMS25-I14]
MNNTDEILRRTSHRPWALPEKDWAYYQEWNGTLFLHWKVAPEALSGLLPEGVAADVFNGYAWVSLVAFTMQKIRPRNLPAFAPLSDFHEINVRTYVIRDGKPGVYFLSIEGGKHLSVWTAKGLSGLPYRYSLMERAANGNHQTYESLNGPKAFLLHSFFTPGAEIMDKTPLDKWLTERYCLYFDKGRRLYRYEIHHAEWKLNEVTLHSLTTGYVIGGLNLNRPPDLAHYSKGVKVLAWQREALI